MDKKLPVWLKEICTTWQVKLAGVLVLLFLCGLYIYFFDLLPPSDFPKPAIVIIPDGMSLSAASQTLAADHIVRSPFWFTNFVLFLKGERKIVGGEYYFEQPISALAVAGRVTRGAYHIDQLKTTIPEGSSVADISLILKKQYPLFDTVHFVTIAEAKEGYLFPDTYYFGADVAPEKIVDIMNQTFDQKIAAPGIQAALKKFGKPLNDVITMASILEGEARQTTTRQIVAGILWKRLAAGIPLQVDSAFRYVDGKTTAELTEADLKIDSPYNTYINKGLPPTPISNPGLDSIMDAMTPIQTNYWYFLTDKNGNMHYAVTLAEHDANKEKYLN
jgi:UPF0755 protein